MTKKQKIKVLYQIRSELYDMNPFKFGSNNYKSYNVGVNSSLDIFEAVFLPKSIRGLNR